MIAKGIKKWPTEVIADTLTAKYNQPYRGFFDLEFTISDNHIFRETIEVSVSIFYYINKEKTIQFSVIGKFTFTNPLNEEATLQYTYGCMMSVANDFNLLLAAHPSDLAGNGVQYTLTPFEEAKVDILRIWKLRTNLN